MQVEFEVGDIVTIMGPRSLYRLIDQKDGYFTLKYIGRGDEDGAIQASKYTQKRLNEVFRLYRKLTKLERALK